MSDTNNSNASLSRRERQIMDLLYEHGEQSARDIENNLADSPSYSAVRTLINRLVDKGHAQIRQDGTKYIYSPVQEQEKVKTKALYRLVKTFFRGSRSDAVNALLDYEGDSLSEQEVNEIERKLKRLKQARDSGPAEE